MDLFSSEKQHFILPNAELIYVPEFFNSQEADNYYRIIKDQTNWQHDDIWSFLRAKNWGDMHLGRQKEYTIADMKMLDFNYPAPLDMMNISINYDDAFLQHKGLPELFVENCRQAMKSGEPGFSFNFGEKENETLRNACTEITSEDDSDVCNLASINIVIIFLLNNLFCGFFYV